jgi:putative ABC transport system permease protein
MASDARLSTSLRSFLSDSRFALRQLRKSPAFAFSAILTLALGIGSTTAIFSVIHAVLLNPYPYKHADRLATFQVYAADQFRAWRFPARAFVDFKEHNHTFEDMFGIVWRGTHLTHDGVAEDVNGGSVTPGTFESLGIPPLLGRSLSPTDFTSGAPPVFVISYKLWTNKFHRDPNILGTTHTLDSQRMTVVGVMPPRFQIGGFDLWMPLDIKRDSFVPGAGIVSNEIWTVGHLKPGTTPEQAAADLQVIATPFQTDDPLYFPPQFRIVANTLNSQSVGPEFKLGLLALMAAVGVLLLIACSNVANLLLARATTREAEFGVRAALGASRLRLVRQLLVESFLLALASCALGCSLAFVALKAIVAVIPPDTIPPEAAITLSPIALLFSLAATILTSVICGLAPALYAVRSNSQAALRSAGKGMSVASRFGKLRNSLVVFEVALAIVLSISSGLIMRSLLALQHVDLGFNPSQVVYGYISWPEARVPTAEQKRIAYRKIIDAMTQMPGVSSATEATNFPPYTYGWTTVAISGKEPPKNRNTASIFCTEGYFQTLGLVLLRGSLFSRSDVESVRRAVVVNQTFVRERFGNENPIGRQVRFSDFETYSDWPRDPYFEIIGVVTDAKNSGLQDPPRPEIYLPGAITAGVPGGVMVRATTSPSAILQQLRSATAAVDPNLALGESGTIRTLLDHNYYALPRFLFITLCVFAAIALVLVAVGIFSVIAYTVAIQTHEIGIRIALGAQTAQILRLVLRKGLTLILFGIAIGFLASYLVTRLISTQIWGVSPTDPTTYAAVSLLALLIGISACLLPALRASQVDPCIALRSE